jgi:hypothetical protein
VLAVVIVIKAGTMEVVVVIVKTTTKIFTIAPPLQSQMMLKVVFAQLIKGGFALYHLKENNPERTQIGVNMECVKCTSAGSSFITANVKCMSGLGLETAKLSYSNNLIKSTEYDKRSKPQIAYT